MLQNFGPFRISGPFHARLPRSSNDLLAAPSRGSSPRAGTGSRWSSIAVWSTHTPELGRADRAIVAAHAARSSSRRRPWWSSVGRHRRTIRRCSCACRAGCNDLGIDRQSAVLIVGGGAVLDMAGYAAATAHRGVRVVRVPTTVLSQDDSGVGVKNGVNASARRTSWARSSPPFAVINDSDFLEHAARARPRRRAWPRRSRSRSIRDAAFFAWLETHVARARRRRARAARPAGRGAARRLHLEHIAQRRRSVRARERAPARLRPLGRPQARDADRAPAAPRRGGRDRHGARHAATRVEAGLLAAVADSACIARLLGRSGFRSGTTRSTMLAPSGGPRVLRRPRRVPRAPRRRAHHDAARRDRPRRRGARDATRPACIESATRVAARRHEPRHEARTSAGRASPHLLHEHPPRRDLGRGARNVETPRRAASRRACAPTRPVRRRAAAVGGGGARAGAPADALDGVRATSSTRHGLYVFTINGFPYGAFHTGRVKEKVYLPDWLEDARLAYTDRLARSSPRCCPTSGSRAPSAPSPGAFKRAACASEHDVRAAWPTGCSGTRPCLHRLRETHRQDRLARARARAGVHARDRRRDRAASFSTSLFARPRAQRVAELAGICAAARARRPASPPRRVLRRVPHGGRVRGARGRLRRSRGAGIRIGKVQVSARPRARARWPRRCRAFADGVYLHQVVHRGRRRTDAAILDLPDAFAAGEPRRATRGTVAHSLPRAALPRGAGPFREHAALLAPRARHLARARASAAPRGRDVHLGRAARGVPARSGSSTRRRRASFSWVHLARDDGVAR